MTHTTHITHTHDTHHTPHTTNTTYHRHSTTCRAPLDVLPCLLQQGRQSSWWPISQVGIDSTHHTAHTILHHTAHTTLHAPYYTPLHTPHYTHRTARTTLHTSHSTISPCIHVAEIVGLFRVFCRSHAYSRLCARVALCVVLVFVCVCVCGYVCGMYVCGMYVCGMYVCGMYACMYACVCVLPHPTVRGAEPI